MILTVTLNTSIDKRYQLKRMKAGEVNRVNSCRCTAGGKGLNVSRVIVLAKEDVIATGFAGGHNGALLEELAQKDGICTEFIHTECETRSCINIMDTDTKEQTELLEGGETIIPEKVEQMKKKYTELLKKADVVTISGSIPRGVDDDIYPKFIQEAVHKEIPVLVDTSGPLLLKCIEAVPTLIKPNQDEIKQITGKEELSREELIETCVYLRGKGIAYVVVSLGKRGSIMAAPSGLYQAVVPKLDAVNTVGCGDSMLAGFAIGIKNHWDDRKILRYASAISAANAMQEATGFYEKKDLDAIYEEVQIESIG